MIGLLSLRPDRCQAPAMRFVEAVHGPDRFSPPSAFKFAGEVIEAEWLLEALRATGTSLIRRRKLPADQMIWIVLAMALFRDRSIAAVNSHLGLARNPADERKRTAEQTSPKESKRIAATSSAGLRRRGRARRAGSRGGSYGRGGHRPADLAGLTSLTGGHLG